MPEEVRQDAKSRIGSVEYVGIKSSSAFQCKGCHQRFELEHLGNVMRNHEYSVLYR